MKKNSFIEGTFIATIAIIIVKILGALYVIPFYNIIGEEGGVLYTYAYNIYNLMLSISITGFPIAMSKLISEYNTKGMQDAKEKTYKVSKNIILSISVICFFILFVFAEGFSKLIIGNLSEGVSIIDIAFVIRVVSFSLLIVPFLSITRGYLQGHNYMSESSTSQIVEQIVRIFVVLFGSYIAIKVFNEPVKIGVAVALFGTFFGGLLAYIYLKFKIKKNQKNLICKKIDNTVIETKEIIRKFITYSIPTIIISVASSIYDFTDMILVLRACDILGFSSMDAQVISSILSNWAMKICMIITAVATGISINIIPNMTEAFIKGNKKSMNKKFCQAINTTIVVSLPMAIGISLLAAPIYSVFYGSSTYGPLILEVVVFASFMGNLNTVINMCLIGLDEYKTIYITNILGLAINLLLDIPLMITFNNLGLFAVWGASFATIIGYSIAFFINYLLIKKKFGFSFKDIFICIKKVILPTLIMYIPLKVCNYFIDFNSFGIAKNILIILIYGIFGSIVYLLISYKNGLISHAFDEKLLEKILNKFRRKL